MQWRRGHGSASPTGSTSTRRRPCSQRPSPSRTRRVSSGPSGSSASCSRSRRWWCSPSTATLVTELNLSTGRLGAVTTLLGVAELIGTIITVWVTDRFGSVRCGMWGMAIAVPPLLGIMAVGTNVVGAVGLMLVMDVAIELAFVAVLPLVSELDVNNRGKAVSHVFVLIMVARAIGSAVSGRIYETGGFNASIAVAATACAGATIALWWSHAEVVPEPVEVSL
ncbi:MAG: MFS transporter [Microthrixaceae bacterium]